MPEPIVSSPDAITLLGGADIGPDDLTVTLSHAKRLVAIDGGGDTALQAGLRPDAVIGDMDSLSPAGQQALHDVLHRIDEQETTDFDKALRHIAAPLVLAVGVTGGRYDHELAMMNVLLRNPDRPCLVLGPGHIVFLCPPELRLDLPVGTDIGLFPFGSARIASQGLEWPTDGLLLTPDGRTSTSNRIAGPLWLAPDQPNVLTILPRAVLGPVVRALLAQVGSDAGRWPARAG